MPFPAIVGLGLISLDLNVELSDLPLDGRVYARRALTLGGGMAANTLAALTALGWRTEMAGVVGDDPAGTAALESLRDCGVGTKWVRRHKGAITPQAVCIAQTEHGRRTIIGLPQRDCEMYLRDLPSCLSTQNSTLNTQNFGLLHTDGWHGAAALAALQVVRQRSWLTSYNGGWLTPYSQRLARLADVVVVSADFTREITDSNNPPAMLREVAQWLGAPQRSRPERWLALTAGDKGAWGMSCGTGVPPVISSCSTSASLVSSRTEVARQPSACHLRPTKILHQPAFPVKVLDSTGAGDAFHAGLLHGRLKGWNLADSLRFAAAAGALSCTQLGARAEGLTLTRILRLLKTTKPQVCK